MTYWKQRKQFNVNELTLYDFLLSLSIVRFSFLDALMIWLQFSRFLSFTRKYRICIQNTNTLMYEFVIPCLSYLLRWCEEIFFLLTGRISLMSLQWPRSQVIVWQPLAQCSTTWSMSMWRNCSQLRQADSVILITVITTRMDSPRTPLVVHSVTVIVGAWHCDSSDFRIASTIRLLYIYGVPWFLRFFSTLLNKFARMSLQCSFFNGFSIIPLQCYIQKFTIISHQISLSKKLILNTTACERFTL
jgi:hypothetical protein